MSVDHAAIVSQQRNTQPLNLLGFSWMRHNEALTLDLPISHFKGLNFSKGNLKYLHISFLFHNNCTSPCFTSQCGKMAIAPLQLHCRRKVHRLIRGKRMVRFLSEYLKCSVIRQETWLHMENTLRRNSHQSKRLYYYPSSQTFLTTKGHFPCLTACLN